MSKFIGRQTIALNSPQGAALAANYLQDGSNSAWGLNNLPTGEGAMPFYWTIDQSGRPVAMTYSPGSEAAAPSEVPYQLGSDFPWQQNLQNVASDSIAHGGLTNEQMVGLLNSDPKAKATVNPDGTVSFDSYSYDDEFDPGNLILAGLAAGVGGLAMTGAGWGGAAGAFDMGGMGSAANLFTGASGAAGADTLIGSGGLDTLGSGTLGSDPDAIELLINNLNSGMSSADAIKAVEAAIPGSTQSFMQFLANNPSQLFSPSTIKSLFSGSGDGDTSWGKLLGPLLSAGLGAYGSSKQADTLNNLAQQYMAFGAPSRNRYEGSFAPGFSMANEPGYAGAMKSASDAVLASLSAKGGNPYGDPHALIEANKAILDGTALPALYNYRNQNASTGGYGAFNTAAPGAALGAANAEGNIYNAIGYGLNNVLNPQPTIADLIKAMKPAGLTSGTLA